MAHVSTVFYGGTLHMTIPSLRFSRFKSQDGSRHGDSRSDSQKKVAQDNGRSGITHSLAFNLSTFSDWTAFWLEAPKSKIS